MLIQLTNIVAGFILSAPKLKELIGGKGAEHIVTAETKLNCYAWYFCALSCHSQNRPDESKYRVVPEILQRFLGIISNLTK